MSRKKVYLSGTSLLPDQEIDRPVVFLVESVINKRTQMRLKDTGYETLPSIWRDRKRLNETSDYLDGVYKSLCEKIGTLLSQIHGVDYPPSFWEIPAASWLLHYVHALYDRYARLKNAVEVYGRDSVMVLASKHNSKPPSDTREFVNATSANEQTAFFFYSDIAKQMNIPVFEFDLREEVNRETFIFKKRKFFSKNLFGAVYRKLKDELSVPVPLSLVMGRKILMTPYGFNKRERLSFSRKFEISFFKGKIQATDKRMERGILLSIAANDEFEELAIRLLPEYMPPYLLEEFESYHHYSQKWADFKAYISSNDLYFNILFCYAASLGRLKGAKIVGCQHGGGYGQYEISNAEFIERRISDYYITWGWADSHYSGAELLPLPQPHLSRSLNRHQPKLGHALWCGTTMPKQLVRFMSYIPDVLFYYLNSKEIFIAHLSNNVRSFLIYRHHPATANYGWLDDELNIFRKYPEVKIKTDRLLSDILEEVELYICDHQSTSFMQAFVINTPTILFWESKLVSERKDAVPLFDLLRKAGILFHDPVGAAKQVNAIWGNVQEWWQHPDRQNARLAFMEKFCNASPDSVKKWELTFKKILSEGGNLSDG